MKTRDEYVAMAERLAKQANHFTYGDGADPVAGGALAAEALVYATLATAAPTGPSAELVALRQAVAELLHDADTSADSQAAEVISRFRTGLLQAEHGAPALALAAQLMQNLEHDAGAEDAYSADELREMDQAAEFAHDAAADEANTADVEAEEADHR